MSDSLASSYIYSPVPGSRVTKRGRLRGSKNRNPFEKLLSIVSFVNLIRIIMTKYSYCQEFDYTYIINFKHTPSYS